MEKSLRNCIRASRFPNSALFWCAPLVCSRSRSWWRPVENRTAALPRSSSPFHHWRSAHSSLIFLPWTDRHRQIFKSKRTWTNLQFPPKKNIWNSIRLGFYAKETCQCSLRTGSRLALWIPKVMLPNAFLTPRDWLKKNPDAFFPKVLMHSFSGSLDIMKALNSLKCANKIYYSFSEGMTLTHLLTNEVINNHENSSKLSVSLKAVPENRILLESDVEYSIQEPEVMCDILKLASETKGWTTEKVASVTTNNALDFFNTFWMKFWL